MSRNNKKTNLDSKAIAHFPYCGLTKAEYENWRQSIKRSSAFNEGVTMEDLNIEVNSQKRKVIGHMHVSSKHKY